MNRKLVTLWDGRRGFFYRSHFAGNPMFQPVDENGQASGNPELADAEDHATAEDERA